MTPRKPSAVSLAATPACAPPPVDWSQKIGSRWRIRGQVKPLTWTITGYEPADRFCVKLLASNGSAGAQESVAMIRSFEELPTEGE